MTVLRRVIWTAVAAVIAAGAAVGVAMLYGSISDLVISLSGLGIVLAVLVARNNERTP